MLFPAVVYLENTSSQVWLRLLPSDQRVEPIHQASVFSVWPFSWYSRLSVESDPMSIITKSKFIYVGIALRWRLRVLKCCLDITFLGLLPLLEFWALMLPCLKFSPRSTSAPMPGTRGHLSPPPCLSFATPLDVIMFYRIFLSLIFSAWMTTTCCLVALTF